LLARWQAVLKNRNMFQHEVFDVAELKAGHDQINYKGITAQKIIFCGGIAAINNPWFSLLPFAPNKGEALLIECTGLPQEHIFKKGLMLAPLAEPHLFWVGSNYLWEYDHDQPTEAFLTHAANVLKGWLKVPFHILDHKASIRPATLERRPFVGLHPTCPSIGILNGMGTKGTSLAPFFAHQLVEHLVRDQPIHPDASVNRFSRILSKTHP
jgi:glycine/D-amino acid oxidase-like deaminating enzyme